MAKDQLRQHRPADGPSASAEALHSLNVASDQSVVHNHAAATAHLVQESLLSSPSAAQEDPAICTEIANPQASSIDTTLVSGDQAHRRRLAQEAAFRRLNGSESHSRQATDSHSVTSTQPVLVREYSRKSSRPKSSTQPAMMRQKRRSRGNQDSSEMPPLESFAFQDILASIDPEVSGSIDKIAEICGRSKMSLADEYSSHLPPQADFSLANVQESNNRVAMPRLEPVEEASSTYEDTIQHERSMPSRVARLSIAGDSSRTTEDLLSTPVTATSAVASQTVSTMADRGTRTAPIESAYIPQLVAWLRNSRENPSTQSRESRRDSQAAIALQRLLRGHAEAVDP